MSTVAAVGAVSLGAAVATPVAADAVAVTALTVATPFVLAMATGTPVGVLAGNAPVQAASNSVMPITPSVANDLASPDARLLCRCPELAGVLPACSRPQVEFDGEIKVCLLSGARGANAVNLTSAA